MERRKASPEQLSMLLDILEKDKELAIGKFTGEGRIRHTNAWIKITEKLNANSGFGSGAIKTPDKWQQTWRDWKSNVRKKAFKIRKNRFTPGSNNKIQLTEAEDKILRLICTNTSVFGISGVSETAANSKSMKWPLDTQHYTQTDLDMVVDDGMSTEVDAGMGPNEVTSAPNAGKRLRKRGRPVRSVHDIDMVVDDGMSTEVDAGMGPNEVTSAPNAGKPLWKRGRPVRSVHDRVLTLEEERIKIEKQKLLEKKRCNNIRLKMEKDRLDIERQKNILLEKLLDAVETLVHQLE